MGKAQRRRGNTSRNKQYGKDRRKGPYKRDIDQIVLEDCLEENTKKLLNQDIDEHKAGLGQHYCVPCARYLISEDAMDTHKKSKQHKKRFKVVTTEEPYTIEEANRLGGQWKPKFKENFDM